jgi:hypothetical protein
MRFHVQHDRLDPLATAAELTQRVPPCSVVCLLDFAWHCLLAVFVSPSLITQTDASVEEALRNGTWLDVTTVLPPSLGPPDVAQLLDKCAEISQDNDHKKGQVCALCWTVVFAIAAKGANNLRHASAVS